MVLMGVGAIRRDLGQLIFATAILDDPITWVIIAVIAGMAAHNTLGQLRSGGHGYVVAAGRPTISRCAQSGAHWFAARAHSSNREVAQGVGRE